MNPNENSAQDTEQFDDEQLTDEALDRTVNLICGPYLTVKSSK